MHRKRARRILGIWKKVSEWSFSVRRRRLTFGARRGLAVGAHVVVVVVGGTDGKVNIERLCLSLSYVENPFNSKVIKSFVPELRSRKCFSCFGIPMLSIYELRTLWTVLRNGMDVSISHIRIMGMLHLYTKWLIPLAEILSYLPNPSARAGYDTRSIFKRSLTGFEFRVFLLLD